MKDSLAVLLEFTSKRVMIGEEILGNSQFTNQRQGQTDQCCQQSAPYHPGLSCSKIGAFSNSLIVHEEKTKRNHYSEGGLDM